MNLRDRQHNILESNGQANALSKRLLDQVAKLDVQLGVCEEFG